MSEALGKHTAAPHPRSLQPMEIKNRGGADDSKVTEAISGMSLVGARC